MTNAWTSIAILLCSLLSAELYAQQRLETHDSGMIAYYRDYAVITTSCATWAEADVCLEAIRSRGGVVSIMLSPQCFLGWVPDRVRNIVAQGRFVSDVRMTPALRKAAVGAVDVPLVEAGLEHFRFAKTGTARSPSSGETRDDDAVRAMPETINPVQSFVQRIHRIGDSIAASLGASSQLWRKSFDDKLQSMLGVPAGIMAGRIHVDLFFYNYTNAKNPGWADGEIADAQSNFMTACDFWVRAASRYNRELSFQFSVYTPKTSSAMSTYVAQHAMNIDDVHRLMMNLGYENPWGDYVLGYLGAFFTGGLCPPCELSMLFGFHDEGLEKEFIRMMKWNDSRAEEFSASQSFSVFAVKENGEKRGAGSFVVNGANWELEKNWYPGLSDYGISVDRNTVIGPFMYMTDGTTIRDIAANIGSLFGALSEATDQFIPEFRGASNVNNPHVGPSVETVTRRVVKDGNPIVLGRISSATPIHVGWITGKPRSIHFQTTPEGIPMLLPVNCLEVTPNPPKGNSWNYNDTIITPMDAYCALGYEIGRTSVPPIFELDGRTYYFEGWYDNGKRTLDGPIRTITIDSVISSFEARFTTNAGGANIAVNTLEARLGNDNIVPGTNNRQCDPAVVLVWESLLTDTLSFYHVQNWSGSAWTDCPGAWSDLTPRFIGAHVYNTGSGPIQPGKTYRFRIVAVTRGGTLLSTSNEVSVTTRPASPTPGTYGYDAAEQNDREGTATKLPDSVPQSSTTSLNAAVTYHRLDPAGYLPDEDYYSLRVNQLFGAHIQITVKVSPGSSFIPDLQVKYPDGSWKSGTAKLHVRGEKTIKISDDGTYIIKVTSILHSPGSLVDRETGTGQWGEYTFTVDRSGDAPYFTRVEGCNSCLAIDRSGGGNGLTSPTGISGAASSVYTSKGYAPVSALLLSYAAIPKPGYKFTKWEGHATGSTNPGTMMYNPATDTPGIRMILPRYEALPAGISELVVDIPQVYQPFLGSPRRYQGVSGTEIEVELPEALLSGFDFYGWSGTISDADVVSPTQWRTSRRMTVKLTRNMGIQPLLYPRPCVTGGQVPFTNPLRCTTAKQQTATLTYGMQAGAGDGLEAGQSELPPVPVAGVADIRLTGITGAPNGCLFDIRGMRPSFTFSGTAQPGDNGNPVTFSWDSIPPSLPGSFLFKLDNDAVDMRTVRSVTADIGLSKSFSVEYRMDTCRTLPKGEVFVNVSEVDATNFPYVRGRVCVKDKKGNPVVTVRPADVMLFVTQDGARLPAYPLSFRPADDCYIFESILNDTTALDRKYPNRPLTLSFVSAEPNGEADATVNITIPIPDTGTDTTGGNGKANKTYAVSHEAGWQLVSLPVQVINPQPKAVFADGNILSPLYAFNPNAGYEDKTTMTFGQGYWLKFSQAGNSRANGLEQTIFDIKNLPGVGQAASNGWNLIGGLSYDVPVSAITVKPAGALLAMFEYANGYKAAATMKPGKGYWVKLQPNAVLHMVKSFTGPVRGASKLASETPYEQALASLPHSREWTITDANGAAATLFATPEKSLYTLGPWAYETTELPPVPPSGAFDARCANGRVVVADAELVDLLVQGAFPMSLSMTGGETEYRVSMSDETDLGLLTAARALRVPAANDGSSSLRLLLRKERTGNALEPSFGLSPAYPNPLQLSSAQATPLRIAYTLASETGMTLTVYDALGRIVQTLVRDVQAGGTHIAQWDGTDVIGRTVPAGVYLVELRAGQLRFVRSLSVLR